MIDHCYFYGIFYLYPSPIKFKYEIDLTKWNFHDRAIVSQYNFEICAYIFHLITRIHMDSNIDEKGVNRKWRDLSVPTVVSSPGQIPARSKCNQQEPA